ncbi:CHAT domain-containing protein [Modestobacter marinus]|uniref:CHAT domain-containing protein n=1 Tax=Modestobacter marinus TaxID=477641 RepID=UPI001C9580D5|nr:CHAT domain-containing protein [Modestobacter marinus]
MTNPRLVSEELPLRGHVEPRNNEIIAVFRNGKLHDMYGPGVRAHTFWQRYLLGGLTYARIAHSDISIEARVEKVGVQDGWLLPEVQVQTLVALNPDDGYSALREHLEAQGLQFLTALTSELQSEINALVRRLFARRTHADVLANPTPVGFGADQVLLQALFVVDRLYVKHVVADPQYVLPRTAMRNREVGIDEKTDTQAEPKAPGTALEKYTNPELTRREMQQYRRSLERQERHEYLVVQQAHLRLELDLQFEGELHRRILRMTIDDATVLEALRNSDALARILGASTASKIRELLGDSDANPAQGAESDRLSNGESRTFNAEVENHKPGRPLDVGERYTVAFSVDLAPRPHAVASGVVPMSLVTANDLEEPITELTVQLDSDDFEISDRTQPLRVPRSGVSRDKARFEIVPLREGRGTLTATLHRGRNFIHQLQLVLPVGAQTLSPAEFTSIGRPIAAAERHRDRDRSFVVKPNAGGGYDCLVIGPTADHAHLPVTDEQLAGAIDAVRAAITDVVDYSNGAEYPFIDGVDIPRPAEDFALKTLARAGARMFQQLFRHPAGGEDARRVGDGLRQLASEPGQPLQLQVVSRSFPVPWQLLYLGDVRQPLSWDLFLGMRHIVECIPFRSGFPDIGTDIPSDPQLSVGLNLNTAIDQELEGDYVACQQVWWSQSSARRPRMRVIPRSRRAEILTALADTGCADQIFYLYCHATASGARDAGGIDACSLELTDGRLTLGELNLEAPPEVPLAGNPLVFVNACDSAGLSPLFYDGFVPYFMSKGARGVVGTECKIPAVFATEWARRFFDSFLDGNALGDVVLRLRRSLLVEHKNPLGLIYAVYCDSDTAVVPALLD